MRLAAPSVVTIVLLAGSVNPPSALAQEAKGDLTSRVRFDQKLGDSVPLDLPFTDESGSQRRLGDSFGTRPVILVPVYYRCPLLCNQVLNALTRCLRALRLDPGRDFELVAYSIDPEETSELARRKRAAYLEQYDRPGTEAGWHFLVGPKDSIERLSQAIGFRYEYNAETRLFTHAAGIVLLTPGGKITRYFYGLDYPPKEVKAEVERAARGEVGSPIARLLLLCYDYDAATGKYTLSIVRLMRILGTATALSLGAYLVVMFRREWREGAGGPPATGTDATQSSASLLD